MNIEDVKKYMIQWNRKFPVDRWWREKHKVAFLSDEHRKTSFLNQLMEFAEDVYFQVELKEKKKELESQEEYTPNTGNYLKDTLAIQDLQNKELSIGSIEEFREEANRIRKHSNGNEQEDNDIG